MNNTHKNESAQAVAVIGYGTAGVNACIALRNAGYAGPIHVFSDTNIRPYSPILTSYYAAGLKEYDECFPWSADELAGLDLDVHENCPVTELDAKSHVIRTPQGDFAYAKCVIATGSTPMPYGFPKDCGYDPIMLRTMDDAERMKTTLESPECKHVLVSGMSMVALKTVEACLLRGVRATMVGVSPHVLDFNALPETATRFENGLRTYGVEFEFENPIQAVKVLEAPQAAEGKLEVTFKDGRTGRFDEISVSHGMKSNLDFLPEGTLEMDRAIVVDEFMRTSDADIYAAGDVVQALELISGEKRIVGIWKNAAHQGEVAGKAIAAELAGSKPDPADAYTGSISMNTIAVKDMLFISAGTMQTSENGRQEIRETDDMTVLYLYDTRADGTERLVGFNLVCDHSDEGNVAYDTGAMLTMRIEQGCRE